MRLSLLAVGRMRGGPEQDLVTDYLSRARRTGRGLGITDAALIEVEPRAKSGIGAEENALRRAVPSGSCLVCLDERGRMLTSPALAAQIADWRDAGRRDVTFVIGGADGLSTDLVAEADLVLSLGKFVWPHLLARVMVAEQMYRATSILAGTPYHRA